VAEMNYIFGIIVLLMTVLMLALAEVSY
jgi:hypothetical protein